MRIRKLGRVEILLPLTYNDGSLVEPEKFTQTRRELDDRFGASSADTISISGHWIYQGMLYEDTLVRIRVDARNTRKNRRFLQQYKEQLKERFRQEDIWITVHEIKVL